MSGIELFRELVAFHRQVAGEGWPVRGEEAAWAHRRAEYVTWIGELETLAVSPRARGRGIGSRLIAACRERLRAEGITHWSVAVVEANAEA